MRGRNMMANCCAVVSQAEISSLKDTLCAQQKLLQQLYNELEAEREAAATAASEALSVILRLQGEKAAVKMEAEQYKRLAEERLGYAEESFAIIEDMITEKEMEVAELDYQVQTYRYQLMSMGFDVPAADDGSFPDHLLHRNDCLARETSVSNVFKGKMAMLERESSDLEAISKHVEQQQMGLEIKEFASDRADASTHEGISCFAEQIKALQQRVREISGANISGFMSESQSPSMSTRPSAVNLCSYDHPTANSPRNGDEAVHSPRPPTVLDVFEVPQADDEPSSYESPNKDKQKEVCETSDILESQDQAQDEPDWLKNLLQSVHHEKDLYIPSDDVSAADREIVKPTADVDVALVQPTTPDVPESNFKKLNRSLEISEEVERPAESSNRAEELKLLKEIKEKLNALENEITVLKVKKSIKIDEDEPSLQPLAEAMYSFWL